MQKEVSPSKKEVSPSKKVYKDEDDILIRRQVLAAMPPMELTSIRRQYSLRPDMIFGWKPEDIHGAPIPMNFDYESGNLPIDATSGFEFPIYYIGKRYNDSLGMHRQFANRKKMLGSDEVPSYHFKFPPHQNVIDALGDK